MTGAPTPDLLALLLVAGLSGAVLASAEHARRQWAAQAERTRKFVHLAMGCLATCFPWVFHKPWPVVALSVAFVGVMGASLQQGWLPSVHGVARRSGGGVFFALAVGLLFFFCHQRPALYVPSILVLAVSDGLAALVGGACGRHRYRLCGDAKSIEGSAAFLASAILCIFASLAFMTPLGPLACALTSLCVAIPVMCLEAVASGGSDNLVVPVATCLLLARLGSRSATELALLASAFAAAMVAIALAAFGVGRRVGPGRPDPSRGPAFGDAWSRPC